MVDLLEHAKDAERTVSVEFTIDEFTIVVSHDDAVYIHSGEPTVAAVGESQ